MDPFFIIPDSVVGFSDGPFEVPFFRIESYGCGEGGDPVEVSEQGVVVTWRDYMGLD